MTRTPSPNSSARLAAAVVGILIALSLSFGAVVAPTMAQVSWYPDGGGDGYVRPVDDLYGLMVPGLATSTTGCLSVDTNGFIRASGSACGSGGGTTFSTTSANFWYSQFRDWHISGGYLTPTTTLTVRFPQGFVSIGSSTIAGSATTTGMQSVGSLFINSERFTDLTGSGLTISGTALTLDTSGDWTGTFDGVEGSGYVQTSRQLTIAGTANQITSSAGAQTLAADRTWTLSLPSHVIFPSSYVAALGTTTNATSTNLTVTGNLIVNASYSGLLKATSGVVSVASGGTDYENPLTFNYPLTRSANAISLAFGTTTQNFWSAYNSFVSLFATEATTTTATSTNLTILTRLRIPNAADPSVLTVGDIAFNTTLASTSVRFYDGTAERALYDRKPWSVVYATSSPSGTTTIEAGFAFFPETYSHMACGTDTGTAFVRLGTGSASTSDYQASLGTAKAFTALASNNTFTMGQKRFIEIGTWSGSPQKVTCSFVPRLDPN